MLLLDRPGGTGNSAPSRKDTLIIMSPRKSSTPALLPSQTEIVVQSPAELAEAFTSEPSLLLIVASDKVRENAEAKVAALMADNGVLSAKADKVYDTLAGEYLRHRRMFPAVASVQEVLGEDVPDLGGKSPAYRDSIKRMNETARDLMVNSLRKEGFTLKLATANADAEMERIRKSISRSIRIAVEAEAKAIGGGDEGARFLLGHGFGFTGEVGKNGVIGAKGWKLAKGEDGAYVLVKPEVRALDAPGAEQSDQATPGETAEAAETAANGGEPLTNPMERIHLVTANLRTVASDPRWSKVGGAERLAEAKVVVQATYEFLTATVAGMSDKERDGLVRELRNMAATFIVANEVKAEVPAS